MKLFVALTFLLEGAAAFPSVLNTLEHALEKRQRPTGQSGCSTSARCNAVYNVPDSAIVVNQAGRAANRAKPQCGALAPCATWSESQLVSTTGNNAYASPLASQIRGPCPGLNAAANHNYLPRSGVPTIVQTIDGLGRLFGMGADLAGFLAAYAVAFDGDPLTLTWSIGGPQGALISNPQGISWSHNKYEGDTSIGRCDAYINGGDAHSLSVTRFRYAYESGRDNDRYTMDKFDFDFAKNTIRSVGQNPYYFTGFFSTTLVAPAAYHFVIAMMSNHTQQQPNGYLDGAQFKTWFGVAGDYPNFRWLPGQERIPERWYRRPLSQPYTAGPGVFGDLLTEFNAYPQTFRFGGNTNGVNTYTGVDISAFTGGVYNAQNLLRGNNLQCFAYQAIQQGLPDVLTTNPLTTVASTLLNRYLGPALGGVTCPQVSRFNNNNLPPYPGRNYNPAPPPGNRQNC